MTDKEKVKAYDEALERARKVLNMILDNEFLGFPDQIREIFPQLRESEKKQSMTRKEAIDKVFGMIGTAEQHEALEFLVPEVRELRESYDKQQEDEKIRKSLIENFQNYYEMYDKSCGEPKWGSDSLAVKDILAYLKKQKPVDYGAELKKCKDNPLYFFDKYVSIKQKSTRWSYPYGRNETVDMLVSLAECLEMDGNCLFNEHTGKEYGKFLRDLARKQVECKSEKWNDSVTKEMFIKALERAVDQTKKGYELTDCDKHSWWEDFKTYSEIKLIEIEWSAEDSIHLTNAILSAQKEWGSESYTANWLKSLPERFNLQPKQEWSEEDKAMLKE